MERLDRISTNSSSVITECVELGKKCSVVAETIVKFCSNIISEHNYLYQVKIRRYSNFYNLSRVGLQ
jgi:hypothetical protein